ncbi:MAG: hypothetical protein N2555_03885 [Endomicrobia bacterium]|nr:hypothetical protein [Endomicrobiia bacterium]
MKKIYFLFIAIILYACSDKPQDRLLSPVEEMKTVATNVDEFIVYDNEIKSGILFYTSANVDFNYADSSQNKCIKFSWDGSPVQNYGNNQLQTDWCGFGLIVGKDWTESNKIHNLAYYGFKKIKFKLRGFLTNNIKFKVSGPKGSDDPQDKDIDYKEFSTTDITDTWKEYELNITNNLDNINIYISFVFSNPGNFKNIKGEIYIDEVKFSK